MGPTPADRARYLALPPTFAPRVRDLAAQVTSGAATPGDKAAAPRVADASAFAAAIARRYNGTWSDGAGGTLPLIRRIEVWNEPNIATYWYPQCRRQGGHFVLDSARQYAALLAASDRKSVV